MKHPQILIALFMLVVLVTASSCFAAGMFRCQDASGKVSYTNLPGRQKDCSPLEMGNVIRIQMDSAESLSFGDVGAGSYDQYIRAASRRHRVDTNLIKALICTESNFDHRAVSSKGAQGLMQLMPGTANDLGVRNVFDPRENINAGTRYFRQQLDTFNGSMVLSLAAYNAGPGLVKRLGKVPQNTETIDYIKKVLYNYKKYKSQERR